MSGPIGSSIAQSFASLTRDISTLTSGSINLTVAASDMAVSVARSSLGVLHESWRGIDVEQAHVTMHGARWLIHQNAVSHDFFNSAIGKQFAPLGQEGVHRLLLAMQAVNPFLPELRACIAKLNSSESLQEFSYPVILVPQHYIGVQLVCVNMSFRLMWANPTWQAFGFDATAELPAIQHRLKGN